MKIVFFGTPDYVLPVLNALDKEFRLNNKSPIVAVVTQKPRPVGRKQLLTYTPVDDWAHKKNIEKFYSSQEFLNSEIKADIGILASYSEIIPEAVIKYFKYGILNIHPSLLPAYRGASPIQAAIFLGDKETGVSIIKLDKLLDHGPIIAQFKEDVLENDTNESLRNRLFKRASEVLVALLKPYLDGKITPRVQEDKKASFTYQIKKQDAFISPEYLNAALQGESLSAQVGFKGKWKIPFIKDFEIKPSPEILERFVRAMHPWPVSWTYLQLNSKLKTKSSKRLKILKSHLESLASSSSRLNATKLILDEVQLEGKNPVAWKQFKQAYPKCSIN